MRLNNRGWGLREMLVLSGILIFFFCIAIYFIYLFYSSLSKNFDYDKETENDIIIYETYEQILYDAGISYLITLDDIKDSVINMSTLINEGYMDEIYDPETDNECNGYIKVIDADDKDIKEYIKCDNYETLGY